MTQPPRPRLQHQPDADPAWLGGGGPRIPPPDLEPPLHEPGGLAPWVPIAIGAAVVLVVIIALVALRGGGDDTKSAAVDAGVSDSGSAAVAGGDAPDIKKLGAETPDTKKPDTKKPDTKEPETKKPDTKKPDTKEPETKKPDTKKPDTKKPDTKPETGGNVRITLLVVPPSASVLVGSKRVHGSITVPRSETSLPVKITASGYLAKTLNVVPDKDKELIIQLLPEPAKEEPDEPKKEEPAKEEPAKDEPAKDEPAKEEPKKEEPAPKADDPADSE